MPLGRCIPAAAWRLFRSLAIAGGRHGCRAGRYRATALRRPARGPTRTVDHGRPTRSSPRRRWTPRPRGPGPWLTGHRSPRPPSRNTEFVILGARQRVDHAPRVPAQVPSLRRRPRDGGEEPAAGQDRAERMQTRAAVPANRRDVADREARHIPGHGGAAMQGSYSWPQPRRDLGQFGCLSLELRPASHPSSLPRRRDPIQSGPSRLADSIRPAGRPAIPVPHGASRSGLVRPGHQAAGARTPVRVRHGRLFPPTLKDARSARCAP